MDTVLLAVTVVSLVVALVMGVATWRVTREDKRRSAARVAALSVSAFDLRGPQVVPSLSRDADGYGRQGRASADGIAAQGRATPDIFRERTDAEPARAPWAPAPLSVTSSPRLAATPRPQEMVLNEPAPVRAISHASGFLGAASAPQTHGRVSAEALGGGGGRQHSLAIAAAVLFVALATGLGWMMSGPRGTTAAALGPNSPLELVSLRHDRRNAKLSVSGLVRNPVAGRVVERLSAVVFLFDQQGTFVTSATSPVDFMKLGVGDESPFVVALDAPTTVTRYRVSFRTDDGVVPHIDRRGTAPIATGAEQPVSVRLK